MKSFARAPCRRGSSWASTKPTGSSPSNATSISVLGSPSSASGSPGPSHVASLRTTSSSPGASRRIAMPGTSVVSSSTAKGGSHAWQASERQEREAVREAEGQGDVEGARGEDRELAGRLESRRQEVGLLVVLPEQLEPGRDDRAEESRRPQGRSRHCPQELTCHKTEKRTGGGSQSDGDSATYLSAAALTHRPTTERVVRCSKGPRAAVGASRAHRALG